MARTSIEIALDGLECRTWCGPDDFHLEDCPVIAAAGGHVAARQAAYQRSARTGGLPALLEPYTLAVADQHTRSA